MKLNWAKTKWPLLLVFLIIAVGTFFYQNGSGGKSRSHSAASFDFDQAIPLGADKSDQLSQTPSFLELCQKEKSLTYFLQKDSSIEGLTGVQNSTKAPTFLKYQGRLHIQTLSFLEGNSRLVRYRFQSDDKKDPPVADLFALVSSRQKIEGWWTLANLKTENLRFFQMLADTFSLMQFIHDPQGRDDFSVQEFDGQGTLITHYQLRESSPSGKSWTKERIHYLETWTGAPGPKIVKGLGNFQLDQEGKIKSFQMEGLDQIPLGAQVLSIQHHLKLMPGNFPTHSPQPPSPCTQNTLDQMVREKGLKVLSWAPPSPSKLFPQEVLDLDPNILLSQLKKGDSGPDKKFPWKAMSDLARLLAARPEILKKIQSEIKNFHSSADLLERDYVRSLIGVMASTHTFEASQALKQVMVYLKDTENQDLWHFTMRSHLNLKNPDPESLELLMKWHQEDPKGEDGKVALLSATAVGRGLPPSLRKEMGEEISEYFQENQGKDSYLNTLYITAMGNLGDPATFPLLMKLTLKGNDNQAAWALDAMRNIPGEKVDQYLLTMAKSNLKKVDFRIVAIDTLKGRYVDEPIVSEMITLFKNSVSPDLRLASLKALTSEKMLFWPNNRKFLRDSYRSKAGLSEKEISILASTFH